MSMTTMAATAAALQLPEHHRIDLDAPVQGYCPTFAELQVLERRPRGHAVAVR